MKKCQIGLTAIVGLIFLGGCASSDGSQNATAATTGDEADTTINLAAAASLEYAFEEELIPMYEKEHDNVKIEGTYDSSGNLQTQIEQGMDADIFFSAATQQMDELIGEELIDKDSEIGLLENKLVLITPEDNPKELEDFADLKNADTIAIGDPESVPAGQYAQESLTNLDLWGSLEDRFSMGTNVTQVLNWTAENSADAGLVYETDAKTTDEVIVIDEAPEDSIKEPILYPVAQLSESRNEEAKSFLEFLQTDEAVKVFEDYGFTAAR
ncbi:molybdate ABC transporter substrate-binding protein [Tetragenococcus halophilus subsp. flandriensis]|uniref:molybdate ABC transporter substrate-binding protein n=1 Tax=Tetragenococcus halophilus TaxID=51669 RepID=UPI0023E9D424|nr:molybdate ABC transporter substrate-binding protein [Tetragenococcus halophilus]GMA07184.1 molybdate ABC transporter substrate-binding protein [Tetragenococcus halophilus subsp. flandriensis]